MVFFAEISFRNMDSSAAVEERIRRVLAGLSRASHPAAPWSGEGCQGPAGPAPHQDGKTPPVSAPVRGGSATGRAAAPFSPSIGELTQRLPVNRNMEVSDHERSNETSISPDSCRT
jgi:hypothetical protein